MRRGAATARCVAPRRQPRDRTGRGDARIGRRAVVPAAALRTPARDEEQLPILRVLLFDEGSSLRPSVHAPISPSRDSSRAATEAARDRFSAPCDSGGAPRARCSFRRHPARRGPGSLNVISPSGGARARARRASPATRKGQPGSVARDARCRFRSPVRSGECIHPREYSRRLIWKAARLPATSVRSHPRALAASLEQAGRS
jgi:hypothetical protein